MESFRKMAESVSAASHHYTRHGSKRVAIVWLLTGGLAFVPEVAAAQEAEARPPATSEAASPATPAEDARARFTSGAAAFAEGRYKDAIDFFLDANRIAPNPAFSYNIGLAYEQLGDAADALRYYRDYLRRLPEASDRLEVEARVVQAENKLAARGVQQVTVLSVPEGATVSVDGRPLGVTPWTGEMEPGTHATSVQMRGYRDANRSFILPADHALEVFVELVRQGPAAAVPRRDASTGERGRRESA
jgi:tetratricopeptide (TPR) repeat protein